MKNKKIILAIVVLNLLILANFALAEYVPIENIPGTASPNDIATFPAYVMAIYKFAIWAVGISSLFMISVGGFMYFTSAGNTSKMDSAKRIIADSIYGLIAVLFAWIILHTINENLVNISIRSISG